MTLQTLCLRPRGAVDHPRYFRPTEVGTLFGDPSKAKQTLDWTPKITFDELVAEKMPRTSRLPSATSW